MTTAEQDSYDPLAHLTISELDDGSRRLGASLVATITQQGIGYEKALALVLYLHERRRDPSTSLSDLTGLTFVELSDRLAGLGAGREDAPPTTRAHE